MRIMKSKSKNTTNYYVIDDVVLNGKRSTKIIESLGNVEFLTEKYGEDFEDVIKKYATDLSILKNEGKMSINFSLSNFTRRDDSFSLVKGGYLFLKDIFFKLRLDEICKAISKKHRFKFDLSLILEALVFNRIINPSSKLSTVSEVLSYVENFKISEVDVYRALSVLALESNFIQSSLYENTKRYIKRNTDILFYDCTNFYFETQFEDECMSGKAVRRYGVSKEHRPNPIVQMGLMMDGSGIPLAMNLFDGNKNEQQSLIPLEEKIISDFNISRFIVCTDGGLSSQANRLFNSMKDRHYITVQSLKKMKEHLKEWALSPDGWCYYSSKGVVRHINLNNLDSSNELVFNRIYFKDRFINENNFSEHLIVTFSFKEKAYQDNILISQLERADKKIKTGSLNHKSQNDPSRLIETSYYTVEGEYATSSSSEINYDRYFEEEKYHGFYAVCTSLTGDASLIIELNKRRWLIERMFRILKTELRARPTFVRNPDRIYGHFLTCFIALEILVILDLKLKKRFSVEDIVKTLREYNFNLIKNKGYVPLYKTSDITKALHEVFGFDTDYEVVDLSSMKKIVRKRKNRK